ncbi:MAG: CvpA family protein [Patescibacteria group bacterium]
MNPIIVDVILVVISILLIWGGYRQGFIKAAGSLLGLVISIGVSIWGVTWLEDLTGFDLTGNPVVFVFTFLTLAIFISQIVRLIVSGLDLVRRLVSIIPFVNLINKGLGLVLGVVQAIILIGAVAYVTVTFLPAGAMKDVMLESVIIGTGVEAGERLGVL